MHSGGRPAARARRMEYARAHIDLQSLTGAPIVFPVDAAVVSRRQGVAPYHGRDLRFRPMTDLAERSSR